MRDKIAEMYDEIESTVMLHQSMPIKNYKEVKEKMIERFNKEILTLLEKCPAMTIENCPWGKENVEFREILLKGINRQSEFREVLLRGTNRQLERIKVEEECRGYATRDDGTKVIHLAECLCEGTGKIRRPATWEDLPPWARIIEGLQIIADEGFLDIMDKNEVLKDHIRIAKSLLKTISGRLVIDSK